MRSAILKVTESIAGILATPLLPSDYLQHLNPLWSTREMRGRVVSVQQLTDDSALLRIKPGRGFDFDYKPGQYVGIGALVDGRWWWRSYSIIPSSAGCRPGNADKHISIAVRAKQGGFISGHLVSTMAPGSIVRLATPAGDFFLPDPTPDRLLLMSAGSGITPVIALLRDLAGRGVLSDVVHIHSVPMLASMMFAPELEALRHDVPGLRVHVRETLREGRFELAALGAVCGDWAERDTFVCGPVGFVGTAEKHWQQHGIRDRLRVERFEVQRTRVGGGGRVTFGRNRRSVVVDGATTLLEASEQAGEPLPYGCRMGICRTCVATLDSGRAVDICTGSIHGAGERIRTCVCTPTEDCVVRG
ncbi:ferredoxin reductase [Nocardia sp. NPDC088792]|uniref:ferredoxin reductase n=1 Tax=Nocardia sp. NPDC088792 TaxID=3364332 RepID=UPI00380E2EC8